ncbi:hypothetical protein O181_115468 [Austropuccinia psidii MF-1]|uniref:Uncharacterized protein n=1 Tax=Austropuccinia psidii MF-1 TaxID=1389203 RepID=A0A9Q3K6H8_9BASI|nr:hypothetical protein [Austropuccinia psidii MF-1]
MEGEDNQLKTPEPQITDGGSAEGEDSVISVSLKLIAEEYASRRFKIQNQSTPNQKKLTSRKWGHNSFMPPLKASKVRIHTPLGLNSSPSPPLQLWGGQDLDVSGPHQWFQAM